MTHLMIDLETLALQPNAVIMQVGVCEFEMQDTEVGRIAQYELDPSDQLYAGRRMDMNTVNWWMGQSDIARKSVFGPREKVMTPDIFINEFHQDWQWGMYEGVWSHGSMFDLVILEDFYFNFDAKVPWHYRVPRDTRTLFALANHHYKGTKHTALEDAVLQSKACQEAWKKLFPPR